MIQAEILIEGLERIRLLIKNGNYKTIRVLQDEYIVKQDQTLDSVFWASVAQYTILHTSQNGKTLSLGDYYSEDRFFGEVEFFSGRSYQFDVMATADTELVIIPQDQFTEILTQDGFIAFWMNCNMSKTYQRSMDIAIERSLYPLKFNILKDIIQRCTANAQPINHTYMYQEAQRFGCTERAYNRIIHELIDEGIIVKDPYNHSIVPANIEKMFQHLNSYYK